MPSQINIKVSDSLCIKTCRNEGLPILIDLVTDTWSYAYLHESTDKHDCSICVILFFLFLFFSGEQQAFKQLPSSNPAGEPAAQEFGTERGSRLGSVSETCASRCLWDFAKRGGPQVVLWQLQLLSTTMAYAGHHYSRGKNKLYYWRLLKEKERKFSWFYKTKN